MPDSLRPSERTIIAAGACLPSGPTRLRLSTAMPSSTALPVAVPPEIRSWPRAANVRRRLVLGSDRTVGVWSNSITPIETDFGAPTTKAFAACWAAVIRLGAMSVACIDPLTSVASRIERLPTGSETLIVGRAAAATRTASARKSAAIGRCRRQPGRRGATEATIRERRTSRRRSPAGGGTRRSNRRRGAPRRVRAGPAAHRSSPALHRIVAGLSPPVRRQHHGHFSNHS